MGRNTGLHRTCTCLRCGYTWRTHLDRNRWPKRCARCNSPYWAKERQSPRPPQSDTRQKETP